MLLYRLRNYVTEPLYRNDCYVDDEYVVLKYALFESQKRILEVLSLGNPRNVHIYMEGFPWQELEELLGHHLTNAISTSVRLAQLAALRRESYQASIFDTYIQKYRAFSFAE